MTYYKERKKADSTLPKKLLKNIETKLIGKLFYLDVYIVNSKEIRNSVDIDFTTGGNPARYAYNPELTLWLEDNLPNDEKVATLIHEFIEYVFMKVNGYSYGVAHDHANVAECVFREKIKKGDVKIKKDSDIIALAEEEIKKHLKKIKMNLDEILEKIKEV